ncbi:tyrosine-type recombinase/integrase [Halarsenatibacter silvermanii]|uniref:Integrase/recombinase XerD n=1 Tax=Halarsenatibacter silvermanii TaxID=321763 RepID=A0A1G9T0V9_9FIRM|nr:tyrosine-type recombinase/integrase [Halarsenatibacter silvermanii]SDM41339.1 integrase/recombinase XerD [Halarsenatibacter silvermanii]
MPKRKIPVVLTEEEQERLLEQPNPRYITGERNYVMLKLMLCTGLRLAEAVNLKWQDINLTSGKITVREGKGGKDRNLWIGKENLELIRNWKEKQTEKAGESLDYVFTSMSKGTVGNKINRRYVQDMVKRYAEKAGIDKNISPHTLRHTFATDLYRETGKIRLVQKALGHADLSTTMIYTHIVDDEMEEALKNFRNGKVTG